MGVTYKLKDEIVEFIVQQKKANAKISCRKLVSIIDETFHVSVSKSSVNEVIKEAQLSSPVGRSPLKSRDIQKFKIPGEKKQQLFGGQNTTTDNSLDIKDSSGDPKSTGFPSEIVQPVAQPHKESLASQEIDDDQKQPKLMPDPLAVGQTLDVADADVLEYEEDISNPIEGIRHVPFDGFEPILMWLALKDLNPELILKTFLRKYMSVSDQDIQILNGLLCLKEIQWEQGFFDSSTENQGIWAMCGLQNAPQAETFKDLFERLQKTKIPLFDFNLELEYLFSKISKVKIYLEDQSEIQMDGRVLSVGAFIDGNLSSFVHRAIHGVTSLLSLKETLIVYCWGADAALSDIKNLFAACQGSEGHRIQKAAGIDSSGRTCFELAGVSQHQRACIVAVSIHSEGVHEYLKKMAGVNFEPSSVSQEEYFTVEFDQMTPKSFKMRALIFPDRDEKAGKDLKTTIFLTNLKETGPLIDKLRQIRADDYLQHIVINALTNISMEDQVVFESPNDAQITVSQCFMKLSGILKDYVCRWGQALNGGQILDASIMNINGYIDILKKENQIIVSADSPDTQSLLVKIAAHINFLNIKADNKLLKIYIK